MNRVLALQRMRIARSVGSILAKSDKSCDHDSCSNNC